MGDVTAFCEKSLCEIPRVAHVRCPMRAFVPDQSAAEHLA